jgi:cytochrome P450
MAKDPSDFFIRNYHEMGSVFRIRIFNKPYTVLAGPEANLFLSRQGAKYVRSREFWQGLVDEYGAEKALVSTDGEIHSRLRKVMRRGYSRSSLNDRYDEVIQITDRILEEDWKPGTTVPVVLAMQRLAAEMIGILVTENAPGEYIQDLRRFIKDVLNVLVTKQRPGFLLLFPGYKRAKERVFELGQKLIDSYDPSKADPDNPTLIDDIMAAAAEDETLFPGRELLIAVTGPYFAGLDTVANTTSALLYAVLKHPQVLERITKEVDHTFAEDTPTPADLREMYVMHGTVMETLRLYPIAVAAMRTSTQAFEFEGYRVNADQPLYMATAVSHFLPQFYPDPYDFDIERCQKPRMEHKKPGAFAPFSLGSHSCLGAGMAEVLMMLMMSRMFNRLGFELVPPDYELKLNVAPAPGPELGFKVRVTHYRS